MACNNCGHDRHCGETCTQTYKDGDGKVSREEFAVVAEKFPNILFPRMQAKKKEED